MTPGPEKKMRREEQRRLDLERLRGIEQHATQRGVKLGDRDRLKAAFHLTRAWGAANEAGVRKEDFQDTIFSRLRRSHKSRREFRLNNWTLRRGEDPMTQPHLVDIYSNSAKPQKALEPYLVGLAVAAECCGADPDDWKLDMLRDLAVWSRAKKSSDISPADDRPAETLEILLRALCAELARRNRLGETFDAIRALSCQWEMYAERLVATDARSMEIDESTFTPACNTDVYFGEMFPFPSVPLLRVPYFVAKAEFLLAPEKLLGTLDANRLATGDFWPVGAAIHGQGDEHYSMSADAPDRSIAAGDLIWFREIRLCIAPDGHGGFTSALETRPNVQVRFGADLPFHGTHHVVGGCECDLEGGLFYPHYSDGGPIWPHIHTSDGTAWRITLPKVAEGSIPFTESTERSPETSGWWFDPDPVLRPGEVWREPWYLSYTPASAAYLRYWLTTDWRLGSEVEDCPWDRGNFEWDDPQSPWNRDLPPVHELNFPNLSHATWIECCLHNDLIEDALQAQIDRLKEQTGLVQADWHAARERNANALLRRWKVKTESMESNE